MMEVVYRWTKNQKENPNKSCTGLKAAGGGGWGVGLQKEKSCGLSGIYGMYACVCVCVCVCVYT